MQPQASSNLPEAIRNDVSIYLAPNEKVLKAIRSGAERAASKGQVWLVLSTGSVIFHTCETGKEPLIALLSRREIREIEYFQRAGEVVLTFVPSRNPQNVTRLSFSNAQRPELEDFCDDLADLINFKKETQAGVKTYSATSTVEMPRPAAEGAETAPSSMRNTASALNHSFVPAVEQKPEVEPVTSGASEVRLKPDVKIVRSSTGAAATFPRTQPQSDLPASVPVESPVSRDDDKSSTKAVVGMSVGYIVAATCVSVLVGYLWYKFFSSLAKVKSQ